MPLLQDLFRPADVASLEARRAVRELIRALGNRDVAVRQAAIEALGRLADGRAVTPLIASLKDEPGLSSAALANIGAPAVDPLLTALRSLTDRAARQACVAALGQIGDERAVAPLLACLQDADQNMRAAAVRALGQIKNERALAPLISRLQDPDRDVRGAVAEALDSLGWQPGQDETGAAYWAAKRWWSKCIEFGALAVGPLALALQDEPYNVAETLEKIGEPAVEPLLRALQASSRDVRRATAKALGTMSDGRAVAPLAELLADPDVQLRQILARALGQLGDRRAVEPLMAMLTDLDQNTRLTMAASRFLSPTALQQEAQINRELRQAVIEALGKLKDGRAIEPLVAALRDPDLRDLAVGGLKQLNTAATVDALLAIGPEADLNVRRAVIEILGTSHDGRAIAPLVAALQDPDAGLRRLAAQALGTQENRQALEPLLTCLQDPDQAVRLAAIEALGQLRDIRVAEPLLALLSETHRETRLLAAEALAHLGAPVVPLLLAALQKGASAYRVMEALEKVGPPAVPPLLTALNDPEAGVRRGASEALGRLKEVRAVPPLLALLQDPELSVRRAAIDTLGRLGDVRAVEPLTMALKDESVRYYAAEAIWKLGAPPAMRSAIQAFKDNEQGQMLTQMRDLCDAYAAGAAAEIARLEPEVVQIGEELHRRGGVDEMRRLLELVGRENGRQALAALWVGIGDWQPA